MNKTHFNYIIAAPSYDPNSGGSIVLHKLCDLLNAQGEKAMYIERRYFLFVTYLIISRYTKTQT